MLPCEKGAAKKGLMSPPLPPFATIGEQLKPALKVERGKGISREFSRVTLAKLLDGSWEAFALSSESEVKMVQQLHCFCQALCRVRSCHMCVRIGQYLCEIWTLDRNMTNINLIWCRDHHCTNFSGNTVICFTRQSSGILRPGLLQLQE